MSNDLYGRPLNYQETLAAKYRGYTAGSLDQAIRGAVDAGLTAVVVAEGVRLEGRIRGPRDTGWDGQDLEQRIRSEFPAPARDLLRPLPAGTHRSACTPLPKNHQPKRLGKPLPSA